MTEDKTHYTSYLLRLWFETGEGQTAWRASIENVHTGERHGFSSLEAFFAYIVEQTRPIGATMSDQSITPEQPPISPV